MSDIFFWGFITLTVAGVITLILGSIFYDIYLLAAIPLVAGFGIFFALLAKAPDQPDF